MRIEQSVVLLMFAMPAYANADEHHQQQAPTDVSNRITIQTKRNAFDMLYIKQGEILMGCTIVQSNDCPTGTYPPIQVQINSFYLMETEVTLELWNECVQQKGCTSAPPKQAWLGPNLPVVNISYLEVTTQFIPWLNNATGRTFRLPTEYEWQYAASEGGNKHMRWGKNIKQNQASCVNCGSPFDERQPAPVKYFPPNDWGFYSMLGNVDELTGDCWTPTRSDVKATTNPHSCKFIVVKGAHWRHPSWALEPFSRTRTFPDKGFEITGFRLAMDDLKLKQ